VGGGGNGAAGAGFSGGYGSAGFIFWWVGDGNIIPVTVGGIATTTSFGTIATAVGNGGTASGPNGGIYVTGQANTQIVPTPGCCGILGAWGGNGPFGLGMGGNINRANLVTGATGFGAGGAATSSSASSGTAGLLIIEIAAPFMNSQSGSWTAETA